MNQCEPNEGACCAQGLNQSTLNALRVNADSITTPDVTLSLDEYQKVLDGITTHINVLLRQKHAIEEQLTATRRSSVELMETAQQTVLSLNRRIAALNDSVSSLLDIIERRNSYIATLEADLRAAKQNRCRK